LAAEAAAEAAAKAEAEAAAEAERTWPPSVPSTPRTGAQYGASTLGFVPVVKATPAVAAAANIAAMAPPPRTQLEAKTARLAEHALAAATQVRTP
jgi:hypothetical protein